MITMEDLMNKTGLTRTAIMHRIKQMGGLPIRYKQGKVGAIRVFTEEDLQAVINYKSRKPGPKKGN